ncbi:MAG: Eco57I restriction-modification methylase domain-containing protein, partial [Sulfurospirillum sp.]|nr:Eco57I restriction-modification methylase domain-containing protein [Sulfurospirillum sp.]
SILENNLYGVDINEDAVEIAKLSLWLRTASKGRELTKLADKIKCGNSLISDKSVVDNAFVWEEEFSEVFENGGFDIVIGNPPYVNISNIINKFQRKWLMNNYKVAKNKSDLYSFFVEKSSSLTAQNGLLGFIISNSWLSLDSFSIFRKFLLEDMTLYKLVKLSNNIFHDATVTVNMLFIKNKICKNYKIPLVELKNNEFININHQLKKDNILLSHNYTISFNENIIFRVKTIKLKDIANFSLGIKTSNDKRFILDTKIDEDCYPMLRGRNISKYYSEISKEYIWYKPSLMQEKKGSGARNLEDFFNSKILIQEIAKNINATFDNNNILVNDTINILYELDSRFHIKYVLSLLNSKVINFWYKNTFDSGLHVKINQLEEIPLVLTNNQEKFINNVDLMLNLNKTLQKTKQNFTNELELEKIPKKLQNFEELDFDEFVKEYKKVKKLKFTDKLQERNFKNEWQELFENDSKIALDLKSQIDATNKEIDEMVYELYGLSDDEIEIVNRQ